VILRLSLFVPINRPTILAWIAIWVGLFLLLIGFHLLSRKCSLLTAPNSTIQNAAIGPLQVNGSAIGPDTLKAPINGSPCFLYQITAWQRPTGKGKWTKAAEETLHLPFFVDDSTGQLLVEPLGADLDLLPDFHEEYYASPTSLLPPSPEELPPNVGAFLARHGIVRHGDVRDAYLRIEQRTIKPDDQIFIAGTLSENPGIAQRPFPPRQIQSSHTEAGEFHTGELHLNGGAESLREPASGASSRQASVPQIIRLETGAVPASSREMTQQAKIAAALTRAGITTPEAWSAAGVPYPSSIEIEDRVANGSDNDENASSAPQLHEMQTHETSSVYNQPDEPRSVDASSMPRAFSVAPSVVLMKGANDAPFVISYRNQKELVRILTLKASALISAGVAGTALGVYLLMQ
jgi:hypothetical protein